MRALEEHNNLSQAIIGFAQFARQRGLNVGIKESQESLKAAALGLLSDKRQLQFGLRSIYCSSS
ncbi:MAG: hypothetical protein ACR2MX_15780, partial [Cyclobacteriaceae bacterium]